ncbi:hypothetical protein D1007_44253 [Hordeum vulgare]|nr:hypothetical protein D1007_44253 [Hordeum vulgare]
MQILNEYLNPELIRMSVQIYYWLSLALISSWLWTCGMSFLRASSVVWTSKTKLRRFLSAGPRGAIASRAIPFRDSTFVLTSRALAPSPMTSSTHLASSAPAKMPSPLRFSLTPAAHSSSINMALVGWSNMLGAATTGTPSAMASSVEFHPQWVTKHPTDGCERTSGWSHHSTTMPFPSFTTSSRQRLTSSCRPSLRTTSRYGRPHRRSPSAISSICCSLYVHMLPNETYTTDLSGCAPSHSMYLVLSAPAWLKQMDPRLGRRPDHGADGEHIHVLPHGRERAGSSWSKVLTRTLTSRVCSSMNSNSSQKAALTTLPTSAPVVSTRNDGKSRILIGRLSPGRVTSYAGSAAWDAMRSP